MTNITNKHDTSLTHKHITHNIHDMSCHEHDHDHDYTEPGVFRYPTEEELGEICEMYRIVTGRELNSISARVIDEFFEQVEPALIVLALERTGKYARRPCAEYAAAILRNWIKAGIRTIADLQASENRRRQEKQVNEGMSGGWWTARRGQEHKYTEADFGKEFYYDPARDYQVE